MNFFKTLVSSFTHSSVCLFVSTVFRLEYIAIQAACLAMVLDVCLRSIVF
uniref:Uncharacterized protein n=1 Tax=Anguilla anguilla TaxID=7936 RepID=A0A0E9T7E3_ANGAN